MNLSQPMDILDAFWASLAQEEEEDDDEEVEEAVAGSEIAGVGLEQRKKFLDPKPMSFSLRSKAASITTTGTRNIHV